MRMRGDPAAPDLSKIPTEQLMKMRGSDAPDPTGSFGENLAAGAGRAITRAGLGLAQRGAEALDFISPRQRNLSDLVTNRDPSRAATVRARIDELNELDKPLMGTIGGKLGDLAGNVAMTVPAVAIPGANTYAGATTIGSLMGLAQPTAKGESVLGNVALGGAAGAGGKYVGDKIAGAVSGMLADRTAKAAALESQNATRDAALAAGREAGYVVPPRMVEKQGVLGSVLEGFGGKVKTEQVASNRNQEVTNKLVRKALGIQDDVPITSQVLQGIRQKAGEAYEALRGAGTINADKQFGSDLAKITSKYEGAAKDFPDLAKNEVAEIVASINKPSFSADAAIDAISILRERAGAAFAKGDKGLGNAYKQTSQAMEDAIERNLLERGSAEAVKAFQAARTLIAKTYSVEKALEGGGNVSAQALATQLKKGKPLTGELKTIGDFAANFGKAAQNVAKAETYSVLDTVAGAGLGGTFGLPAAAIPLARPAARSLVLSEPYQRLAATPSYGPSKVLSIADMLAQNPALRAGATGGAVSLANANQ